MGEAGVHSSAPFMGTATSVVTQISRALYHARFSRTPRVSSAPSVPPAVATVLPPSLTMTRTPVVPTGVRASTVSFSVPPARSGTRCSDSMLARRHGLQPDRLPDARTGRVGGAAGVQRLLAAKLPAGVGRVPDRDDDFLRAFLLQGLGDVEREGIEAAAMAAEVSGR